MPAQRYTYYVPGGVRSAREVKTSPFLSFWYVDLGPALNGPFIKQDRRRAAAADAVTDRERGAAAAAIGAADGAAQAQRPPLLRREAKGRRPVVAGHRSQVQPALILSCLILSYLILSSCLILSYLILSYLILSYLILSYL
eukprot:SAG31_NODE_8899_length_1366_cov_1.581689_1_plen_140_part_10